MILQRKRPRNGGAGRVRGTRELPVAIAAPIYGRQENGSDSRDGTADGPDFAAFNPDSCYWPVGQRA